MSDDELFGNDEDLERMEEDFNQAEGIEHKQTQEDSDIDEDDFYDEKDFFGKNNLIFSRTTPFSMIDPPKDNRTNNPFL